MFRIRRCLRGTESYTAHMDLGDMDKRTLYFLAGGAAALLIIVGIILYFVFKKAPTTSSGPITLTMWDPFEDSENFQPLFDAFEKQYPNVHIVYTKKDVTTYEGDLVNALAAGNGPDIFSINNNWLPEFSDKVTPASSTVISYTDYKNTFVDVAVNDFTKNQKIYGIPMSVDSLGLYYNKDLMGTAGIPTPPKTWDELALDVQKIRRQDSTGYFSRSGVAIGTNSNVNRGVDVLYLFMLQRGVVPYSSDGLSPQFGESVSVDGNSTNPGSDGLAFYTSFANPTSPNYNWNHNSDYSIDAFANGRAAFLFGYSYVRQTLQQKAPNLNYDVAPVPQPNLDDPSVNFANYWGDVVSKQSKHTNAAWVLLKFMTSKAALDKYYSLDKLPSSRKDLISLQIQDPDIGVFANASLTAKSFYKPNQSKVDDIFGQMIDNVILNHFSVDQSLSQGEEQAATLTRQ